MDGIVAHDARVWAILKTPDEYFAKARRKAWLHAKEDVAADLARRARCGDGTQESEELARRSADSPLAIRTTTRREPLQRTASKTAARPCPPPMHIVSTRTGCRGGPSRASGGQDPGAGGADRVAQRDARAVDVDPLVASGRASTRAGRRAPARRRPR